jgi:membrane associated rhomboid family serine protease
VPADREEKGAGVIRVVKAILYGYVGAVLAGLLVALAGTGLDLSYGATVSTASLSGAVFGILGFTVPWWRPMILARSRSRTD